ncbi:gliding motility-associated ABC transporter substrate-binding protein GldG [soil metagenome]
MGTQQNKKKNLKTQALLQLFLLTAILVLANFIGSFRFVRFDLTSDKRFTLSDASKKLVGNLKDVVYIKVYLEGDFSPGFKKLRNSTQELLDELRTYSKGNIEYEFIDPSVNPDEKERNKLYGQLYQKGIQPTTLEERTNEGINRKYIFPGAVISYSNMELGVQLLKDQMGAPPEVMLNNSIQNLEYELVNGIRKATSPLQSSIAFIEGHGELTDLQTGDISTSLRTSYQIKRVRIEGVLKSLDNYKAIIIAKPDSAFDEKDKFIIDQYIMNGGKVVWLIDQMQVTMDSLERTGETIGLARNLNIDDMLFRYGCRINYDLVQDLISSLIPVVTGYVGNQPKQQLMPWYYFPLMTPMSGHPIVNNLNAIKGQFVSSIDSVSVQGVSKSVLLTTSKYSRIQSAPARVSLGVMQYKPDPKQFPVHYLTTGLLLEGSFTSLYKNRIPPQISDNKEIAFRDSGKFSQQVVISDGDIIRNDVQKGSPAPLGLDRYTQTTYGNKNFIQNIIDYLCDDTGLMAVRNKELKLRLIDPTVLEGNTNGLKAINTGGPIAFILIFGLLKFYLRRRRYKI